MKRKNATRSALITSIISLLLCVSMLVSTTFAWFTDEVVSGNNVIAAGNLDIELYNSLTIDENKKVTETTKLFEEITHWEPGVVAYENLTVANVGSLTLKYQLSVNFSNATQNAAGDTLAKVLKVGLVTDGVKSATREGALTEVKEWLPLESFVQAGKLDSAAKDLTDAQTSNTYGIVIYWAPSDIDNEFNMNNANQGKIMSIDLGVKLLATQLEAEGDSFGTDYDKNAWHDAMQVQSAQDLQAALSNGEDVVLQNDITSDIIEITEDVKINLNGKALTTNLAIAEGADVVIANGNIATASSDNSAIETVGNLTLDNVNVKSQRHGVRVEGGVTVINGGTYEARGFAGRTQHALNVSDGGEVIVNGGTFIGPAGTASDSGAAVNVQAGSKVTINGGNFSGGKLNTLAAKGTLIVNGGTFDQDPSAYVTEGYKAVKNSDGTYTVLFPQESFDSLINGAEEGDTVEVPAGTYTFPASKLKAGVTLECAEGTVFEGTSKLNINGATVVGATFSNPSGTAADQTINGTFKDCTFTGSNGLRWCYAGETVVFENCVFEGTVYGVHFDGGANDVLFKDCTLSGFNALGGAITKLTMDGCTFKPGRSGYNGINLWGSVEMTDCTFVFDGTKTEWIDLCGDNITGTFTNCVVTDGTTETPIANVIGDYGTGNTLIVDGNYVVGTNEELKTVLANGATKALLTEGEYDLNGIQKDGLTLIGVGNEVKMANNTKYAGGKSVGAIWQAINLENMTITNTVYTMADGGNSTFTKVNFAAGFRQGYGKNVVFTDCSFGSNTEGYALHFQTDSASEGGEIKLNGCAFEGGKVHLGGKRAYTFTGCDFTAGTDFQVWSNITVDGCTVDGVDVTAENIATFFPNLNLDKVTIK